MARGRVAGNKVLMILVNLISNARYALDAVPEGERRLCVKLERLANERIRIEVRDNGVGIAPEMLTRIFQHGFTTREEGNGFGLHSSALAAQDLGGGPWALTARVQGRGPPSPWCSPPSPRSTAYKPVCRNTLWLESVQDVRRALRQTADLLGNRRDHVRGVTG